MDGRERDEIGEPFKSYRTILRQEVRQAQVELERPALGLLGSGLLAGFGIGISILSSAAVLTLGAELPEIWQRLLRAHVFTLGFIAVIMGRSDLFTEYTTLAILPVLRRRSSLATLGRLWALVLAANLVGAASFAALLSALGPGLGLAHPAAFDRLALEMTARSAGIIVLSAFLAGWLMGLLSWLVTAGRDSVSQILFIWLITFSIGFGGLHHVVSGSLEVLASVFGGTAAGARDFGRFLLWTALGNVLGGIAFAVLIHLSVVVRRSDEPHTR